jgi:microcystin-dependent protein
MFTQPTLGTITVFAGNTPPNNWLFCQGQVVSIDQYPELYSLLGDLYGGDSSTFNLPDLRGRVAVSAGQAPGMDNYILATPAGNELISFTSAQLGHTHAVSGVNLPAPPASSLAGTTDIPTGNVPAQVNGAPQAYSTTNDGTSLGTMSSFTTSGPAGEDDPYPVNIVSPFLAMNYIICVNGAYPSPPEP